MSHRMILVLVVLAALTMALMMGSGSVAADGPGVHADGKGWCRNC